MIPDSYSTKPVTIIIGQECNKVDDTMCDDIFMCLLHSPSSNKLAARVIRQYVITFKC